MTIMKRKSLKIKRYNSSCESARANLSIFTGIHTAILAKWNCPSNAVVRAEYDDGGEYTSEQSPLSKSKSGKQYLNIEGPIVDSETYVILNNWFGVTCVSGEIVRKALDRFDGTDLIVRINCPGGTVTEASSIYNSIVQLGKSGVNIETQITGLAASAATLVMLATEKIEISPMGFMLIHGARSIARGDKFAMESEASLLDKFDKSMASLYSERMGTDEKAALEMMANPSDSPDGRGTWFAANEALEAKLVTSILSKEDEDDKEDEGENSGEDDNVEGSLPTGKIDLGGAFSGELDRFKALSFIFNSV